MKKYLVEIISLAVLIACVVVLTFGITGCTASPDKPAVAVVLADKPEMCAGKHADGTVIIHECFP